MCEEERWGIYTRGEENAQTYDENKQLEIEGDNENTTRRRKGTVPLTNHMRTCAARARRSGSGFRIATPLCALCLALDCSRVLPWSHDERRCRVCSLRKALRRVLSVLSQFVGLCRILVVWIWERCGVSRERISGAICVPCTSAFMQTQQSGYISRRNPNALKMLTRLLSGRKQRKWPGTCSPNDSLT